jgi:hypothetical protein
MSNIDKAEIRRRLKQACLDSRITQIKFVKKYYGNIIPLSIGGMLSAYSNIQSTLGVNNRGKVQDWLIRAIEAEEKYHADTRN